MKSIESQRVKFFSSFILKDLETQVNTFIKQDIDSRYREVKNIQYNVESQWSQMLFSAMVFYNIYSDQK